jgi:hypothetical protein
MTVGDRDSDERALLAIVADDFKLLNLAEKAGLTPQHFTNNQHREAFEYIQFTRDSGEPNFPSSDDSDFGKLIALLPRSAGSARKIIRSLLGKIVGTERARKSTVTKGVTVEKRTGRETPREILWLRQVFADRTLPLLCFHLAWAISQLWNSKTGYAWPSQEYLANKMQISVRSIRRNVDPLVARGHLSVVPGKGRSHSSRYTPVVIDAVLSQLAHGPPLNEPDPTLHRMT